jgi:hypothetical protein
MSLSLQFSQTQGDAQLHIVPYLSHSTGTVSDYHCKRKKRAKNRRIGLATPILSDCFTRRKLYDFRERSQRGIEKWEKKRSSNLRKEVVRILYGCTVTGATSTFAKVIRLNLFFETLHFQLERSSYAMDPNVL